MSRIRSLHPGQFKDDDFTELSPWGRLLTLGIRNLADDNGVFEWKPKTIKRELFPDDTIDVAALLDELVANKQIVQFEESGKRYGAIRNFRRWQRPEKPKSWHPLPDDMRAYVGLVADRSPTAPQKSWQMEGEGGRREDEGGKEKPPSPSETIPPSPTPSPIADRDRGAEQFDSSGGTELIDGAVGMDRDVNKAVGAWNAMADRTGLATVKRLTSPRRTAIRKRLAECGNDDGFGLIVAKIEASPFLCGTNDRGWKADLDWLLKPANFTKVAEGNYDERGKSRGAGNGGRLAAILAKTEPGFRAPDQ